MNTTEGLVPAKVLAHAADLVDRGWVQFMLAADADGSSLSDVTDSEAASFCIIGAGMRAIFDLSDGGIDVNLSHQFFETMLPPEARSIDLVKWNNHPRRTATEVSARLRKWAGVTDDAN